MTERRNKRIPTWQCQTCRAWGWKVPPPYDCPKCGALVDRQLKLPL